MAGSSLLAGRVAIVTGGGSGLGRAACELLAKNGASVAVVDLKHHGANETLENLEPIPLADGHTHKLFLADVSKWNAVHDLVGGVTRAFDKPPSILVNSAGITRDQLMLRMTEKEWDDVIDVNLKGSFMMCQAVSQLLIQHYHSGAHPVEGSFINISSIIGKMGNVGQTNYAASKAGVIGMTKSMAKELSRFNIRVNAIAPGFIATPMTEVVPEKVMKMVMKQIPMNRMGQPEDVAEACLYLASNRSSYVTGTCLEVTGGLSM